MIVLSSVHRDSNMNVAGRSINHCQKRFLRVQRHGGSSPTVREGSEQPETHFDSGGVVKYSLIMRLHRTISL